MLAEQPEKYEKTESSSESWNPISLAFRRISHPTCSSLCEVRQLRKPNTEIAARHGSAAIEYERKTKLVGGVGTGLLTSRRSKKSPTNGWHLLPLSHHDKLFALLLSPWQLVTIALDRSIKLCRSDGPWINATPP